jgi:hypothetical protein
MQAKGIEDRIGYVLAQPLEPSEYCRRWVGRDSSRGYRKTCVNAIAVATGLSPNTVKDWGSDFSRRPQYIPLLLRRADVLNQVVQLVLSRDINLPSDFPQE